MAKIRVHELAKELNVSSKDIMKKLEVMGVFVPNHMSTLEPGEEAKVREAYGAKPAPKKPEGAPKKRVVIKRTAEEAEAAKKKPETVPVVEKAEAPKAEESL